MKRRITILIVSLIVLALAVGSYFFYGRDKFSADVATTTTSSSRSVRLSNYNDWAFKDSDNSTATVDQKITLASKYDELTYTEFWDRSGATTNAFKQNNSSIKLYRLYTSMLKPTWDTDWSTSANTVDYLQFPISMAKMNDPNNIRSGAYLGDTYKGADDWWLRDGNGTIITSDKNADGTLNLKGSRFADLGKLGFAQAYLEAVSSRNNSTTDAGKQFNGFVFDYWWPDFISGYLTKKNMPIPASYPSDTEWYNNAWKPFIDTLVSGLKNKGYEVIGNCAGEYNTTSTAQKYQRSILTGTIYESGFLNFPDALTNPGGWLSGSTVATRIDSLSKDPLTAWVGTYGLKEPKRESYADDTSYNSAVDLYNQKRLVDLAGYYVGLPSDPNLQQKRSYHYYRDGSLFWDSLWDINIGTPSADRVQGVDANNVAKYAWSRKFTSGIVLLNYGDSPSSTESITFSLDRDYVDQTGKVYSGSVTLPAHTALILQAKVTSTVSITSPSNNTTVSGDVTISASPTGASTSKVEYYLDDISMVGSALSSPYSIAWDSKTVSNSLHKITAKLIDSSGQVSATNSVSVTVKNADATIPIVSITSPVNGSIVAKSSTVNITAIASDNVAVSKVEFYINGVLVATDTVSPYSINWKIPKGKSKTYRIQAKAYDTSNNTGGSNIIQVTSQ